VALLTVTAWITAVQRIVYVRNATAAIDAAGGDPDHATHVQGASTGGSAAERRPGVGAGLPT
jgi:hypothetical protein